MTKETSNSYIHVVKKLSENLEKLCWESINCNNKEILLKLKRNFPDINWDKIVHNTKNYTIEDFL